jgi:6-pyruvoyltetrahydropterin/6-carboxytetrahydropterin synthase
VRVFGSTKTYTHSVGLSCAFRQWRADSHCKFVHGYAIEVTLDFQATRLDKNGWVVDFGGLKDIKKFLETTFDHKLLVADSDPQRQLLYNLGGHGLADIVKMPEVGCEAFATFIANYVASWLPIRNDGTDRIWLKRVTVREHDGNSAYVDFGDTM